MRYIFELCAILLMIAAVAYFEQYRAERCFSTGGTWDDAKFGVCVYPVKGDAK